MRYAAGNVRLLFAANRSNQVFLEKKMFRLFVAVVLLHVSCVVATAEILFLAKPSRSENGYQAARWTGAEFERVRSGSAVLPLDNVIAKVIALRKRDRKTDIRIELTVDMRRASANRTTIYRENPVKLIFSKRVWRPAVSGILRIDGQHDAANRRWFTEFRGLRLKWVRATSIDSLDRMLAAEWPRDEPAMNGDMRREYAKAWCTLDKKTHCDPTTAGTGAADETPEQSKLLGMETIDAGEGEHVFASFVVRKSRAVTRELPSDGAIVQQVQPVPGGEGGGRQPCFYLENAVGIVFEGLMLRDCWLSAFHAESSRNITLQNSLIIGSQTGLAVDSRDRTTDRDFFRVWNNIWVQDYLIPTTADDASRKHCLVLNGESYCSGLVWRGVPWWVSHFSEWRELNSGLFESKKFRGVVDFAGNTVFSAYNGIRIKIKKKPGEACPDLTSARMAPRVRIYDNSFMFIRDNPIEAEVCGGGWLIAGNHFLNDHSWISIEGTKADYALIFGNTGYFDEAPGADCTDTKPGDETGRYEVQIPAGFLRPAGYPGLRGVWREARYFDYGTNAFIDAKVGLGKEDQAKKGDRGCATHRNGAVLKVGKSERYFDRVFVFHNSFYLRDPLISGISNGATVGLTRFVNNAFSFHGRLLRDKSFPSPGDAAVIVRNAVDHGLCINPDESADRQPVPAFYSTGRKACPAGRVYVNPADDGSFAVGETPILSCYDRFRGRPGNESRDGDLRGMMRDQVSNRKLSHELIERLSGKDLPADCALPRDIGLGTFVEKGDRPVFENPAAGNFALNAATFPEPPVSTCAVKLSIGGDGKLAMSCDAGARAPVIGAVTVDGDRYRGPVGCTVPPTKKLPMDGCRFR